VVQNLTDWPISNPTAPPYDPDHPDQNVRSEMVYDENGNVLETIDNAGHVTRYCYDDGGRLGKTISNPAGTGDPCDPSYVPGSGPDEDVTQQTVYDAASNAIATINPLGRITRTYYDALNRPYAVVQNLTNWLFMIRRPNAARFPTRTFAPTRNTTRTATSCGRLATTI
jgi:YD repeat-containing protein